MKTKKLIIIILSVLAVAGVGVGVAGVAGVFSPPESSSSQTSSNQDSSSAKEEIVKVELPAVGERLNANVEKINLKDVYLIFEGDTAVIGKAFEGVTVGEIVCHYLQDYLEIGYYSDGNWWTVKDSKLKKCNKILTVIFDYEIGCGEPLALSQSDLTKYGNTKVITFFENQFEIEISSLLESDLITDDLFPGILGFMDRIFQMTVNDLYNLTDGDYTYVKNFIEQTDVDEVINLIFDVLSIAPQTSKENYSELRKILRVTLNGKITQITVDESIEIIDIVNAIPSLTIKSKLALMNLYADVTIGNFKTATLNLDVDKFIEAVSIVLLEEGNFDKEEIDKEKLRLTELFDGTLNNLTINKDGDVEGLLTDILTAFGSANAAEKAKELAQIIIQIITLRESVRVDTENLESDISTFIQNSFGCNMDDPIIASFVADISKATASLVNGSTSDLENFAAVYGSLTIGEIDGYLGGKISKLIGNNFATISQTTVGDIKLAIERSLKNTSINVDELLTNLKNANGDIQLIYNELKKTYDVWFEANKDKTLGGLLGEGVITDEKIANIKIGELLGVSLDPDLRLSTLDDLLFNRAIEKALEGSGLEGILKLTTTDLRSILNLQASENSLNILENISLKDLLDFVQSQTNLQENVEQIAA